jgi:hypothetical protein
MNTVTRIDNPWKRIGSQSPFVLGEDVPVIEAFNSAYRHNADKIINLYHTPIPRNGPVTAPVVFLLNNPSYPKDTPHGYKDKHIISRELESIKDENYPHLELTPNSYWYPRFRELMNESGLSPERLSRNICSIQFFPYRSLEFGHGSIKLPSQTYTFALVRERLANGALIIVMRGYKLWVKRIPEIAAQMNRTVFRAKNPRCIYASRSNLPDGVFDKIRARLYST